ncbi:MAG: diadenylate cyclase CdaA [Tannerella sp.]|jgi:uncharacterized protein (TIGR00159 family)|nr:diadenylate cyclase CdaA [Tannerella sp.]
MSIIYEICRSVLDFFDKYRVIIDAADVLLLIVIVAYIMYQVYKLMRRSGNMAIFKGILTIIVVWLLVSQVFKMRFVGPILDKVVSGSFIVLVILFQNEIRHFLMAIGSSGGWRKFYKFFDRKNTGSSTNSVYDPVVKACVSMAKSNTGALIVIQQEMDLARQIESGDVFNADISERLIENIFFKNSPLHDGAMIIVDKKIVAAGCTLPIAHNAPIPKELGLRHRSGLGMSMETDALVIIVSEERGSITVAHNSKLNLDISSTDLEEILSGKRNV